MADEILIVPYRDGPYLVRGPATLRDQDGENIDPGRSVVALCRCGKSRTRPFCDGSHHLVHFRAPSGRETRGQDQPLTDTSNRERAEPNLPEAPAEDLAVLDRELRKLRRRLVVASATGSSPVARPALRHTLRLLAAASDLLHQEVGTDPRGEQQ
jgi:CDGSH-type Zn-finger protein